MTTLNNDFLTNREAAAYLSVTAGTLSVWRTTGRYSLPYLKVGRLVRYRRSDLDEWLKTRVHRHTSSQ
jgi:excisionase family DNA binding protein